MKIWNVICHNECLFSCQNFATFEKAKEEFVLAVANAGYLERMTREQLEALINEYGDGHYKRKDGLIIELICSELR